MNAKYFRPKALKEMMDWTRSSCVCIYCSICGITKRGDSDYIIKNYWATRIDKPEFVYICNDCKKKEVKKEHYQKNKEKRKAKRKERYHGMTIEEKNEYMKQCMNYAKNNPKMIKYRKEYSKKYYKEY